MTEDLDGEVGALTAIYGLISVLDRKAQIRMLAWLADRLEWDQIRREQEERVRAEAKKNATKAPRNAPPQA